jgi:hypothetical protein
VQGDDLALWGSWRCAIQGAYSIIPNRKEPRGLPCLTPLWDLTGAASVGTPLTHRLACDHEPYSRTTKPAAPSVCWPLHGTFCSSTVLKALEKAVHIMARAGSALSAAHRAWWTASEPPRTPMPGCTGARLLVSHASSTNRTPSWIHTSWMLIARMLPLVLSVSMRWLSREGRGGKGSLWQTTSHECANEAERGGHCRGPLVHHCTD